jgi:hypothetical protein
MKIVVAEVENAQIAVDEGSEAVVEEWGVYYFEAFESEEVFFHVWALEQNQHYFMAVRLEVLEVLPAYEVGIMFPVFLLADGHSVVYQLS